MQYCMDQNIGKVIDTLKTTHQLDNTLIVFISDNGGSVEVSHAVNAPLRGTKGTLLEGGIRVPTIYSWPGKIKPGTTYKRPVMSTDIMATFITAAGGTPPPANVKSLRVTGKKHSYVIYDSVDLLPYLTGKITEDAHDAIYWRAALRGSAIRKGDWKLLRPASQRVQLYNLKSDIGETHNVIDQHPEIAQELTDLFIQWETTHERCPMFVSDAYWNSYCRALYLKKYSLTQPLPSDTEDIWEFKRPAHSNTIKH